MKTIARKLLREEIKQTIRLWRCLESLRLKELERIVKTSHVTDGENKVQEYPPAQLRYKR